MHGKYAKPSVSHTDGAVEVYYAKTFIQTIPDRDGQYLYNKLLDTINRYGYPKAPDYELTVAPIRKSQRDLDITQQDNTTRTQLTLKTTMTLKSIKSGEVLLSRRVRSLTSYNVLSSEFATRVSRQSAQESALNDLAKQIETQLALYYSK